MAGNLSQTLAGALGGAWSIQPALSTLRPLRKVFQNSSILEMLCCAWGCLGSALTQGNPDLRGCQHQLGRVRGIKNSLGQKIQILDSVDAT